jgi:phosphonate degradation associated HDIG domain protein
MNTPLTLHELFALYDRKGDSLYGGEAVSQLQHGLQCALAAEQAGEPAAVIVAALLHDLGHLLLPENDPSEKHQETGAIALSPLFPATVTEVIRLHVDAKRYCCAVEEGYWEALSPASKQSLIYQGGAFTPAEAADFITLPAAEAAVRVRRYDDRAKEVGLLTPSLDHYRALAAQIAFR